VRLFLDTSVLLAACGSDRGASREVVRRAPECDWILLATPYVVEEVFANLSNLAAHPVQRAGVVGCTADARSEDHGPGGAKSCSQVP
jgi:hypothetical protein